MKDQLISFETAKLAKEKGFLQKRTQHIYTDNYGFCWYGDDGEWLHLLDKKKSEVIYDCNGDFEGTGERYDVPTQSLLQKWLREEHNLEVVVKPSPSYGDTKAYSSGVMKFVFDSNGTFIMLKSECGKYNTYEEALEEGLKEALKLI